MSGYCPVRNLTPCARQRCKWWSDADDECLVVVALQRPIVRPEEPSLIAALTDFTLTEPKPRRGRPPKSEVDA